MGTDLFDVTVLARSDKSVKLGLRVRNRDYAAFRADRSMALLLLLSPDLGSHSAISKAVPAADASRAAWMKQHARAYITDVNRKDLRPQSVALEIGVTHPAWIEHLVKGTKFTSRALPIADAYEPCPPAAPPAKPEAVQAVDTGASGCLSVPNTLWFDSLDDVQNCPELLSLPAYAPDAYVVTETAKAGDQRLRSWVGQAVGCGDRIGALVFGKNKRPALLTYRLGHRRVWLQEPGKNQVSRTQGYQWHMEQDLGMAPIGRLALRAGKRPKAVLTYEKVQSYLPGMVTGAKAKDRVLTLTIEHGPASAAMFASASASDMFWLLLQTLSGKGLYNDGKAALAKATRADGIYTLQRPFLKLSSELASKYVEGFKLERPKGVNADERSFGTATLTIRVTDARWLQHVKPSARFPMPPTLLPKPVKRRCA